MARVNAPLLAFNRGEVSKTALARIDLAKLQLAAQCQLNWEPKVVGSMGLRPGLAFIDDTIADQICVLVPFFYAKGDTALLELTANQMRVRIDNLVVERPAVSTAVLDPHFAGGGSWATTGTTSGAVVTIAAGQVQMACAPRGGLARISQTVAIAAPDQNVEHGLSLIIPFGPVTLRVGSAAGAGDYISQTLLDSGRHSLSFTPTGANAFIQIETNDPRVKALTEVTIEAAGELRLITPWAEADLRSIRTEQQGDIVYVAAYGIQQYKIERRGVRPGARGWSIVEYRSDNGPFMVVPSASGISLWSSVYEGSGNLQATHPLFDSGHVNALFQLFTPGQTNQVVLGGDGAFSDAIRVSGVNIDRKFSYTVGAGFVGTLTLQRSLEGPDFGFADFESKTVAGIYDVDDTNSAAVAGVASLNNVIAWYRLGFKTGGYTSGSTTISFGAHSVSGNAAASGGRYAICRIQSVLSSTLANMEVLTPFSSLQKTDGWLEGEWSTYRGWPTAVGSFESRLTWSGRDRMWLSQSDFTTGFAVQDSNGLALGDSGAIIEGFGQGPVDSVNWMLSLTRPLFGREGSIAAARSSSFDEPLSSTNFSVKDCSTQGATRLKAVKVDKRGIFVQQSGRRVYELVFESQALDYSAHDLTRLNIDIGRPNFVDIAIARQPDTAIYLPRTEGQCAVLLYDPEDEVVAWWRIQTLGVIESVCVLPSASGIEDDVYFVVKRTVNGAVKRFIELLARRDDCIGGTVNQLLDCNVSYSGVATTTVTLPNLPLTTVGIWGDGAYLGTATTDISGIATLPGGASCSTIVAGLTGSLQTQTSDTPTGTFTGLSAYEGLPAEVFADQQPSGHMGHVGTFTVSGGTITLPNGRLSSSIVAIFGFLAPFMSAKLAYAAQAGSPMNQKKKIDHVGLMLCDTHKDGIQLGQRFDKLDALPAYEAGALVADDTVWGEYDEPTISAPGEWDTDARLCLLGTAPFPCKVAAAVVAVATNET